MYVGKSDEHSNMIGLVLNLATGAVTPQYHVIYDEQFTTVGGRLDDPLTTTEWNGLLLLQGLAKDPEIIEDDPIYPVDVYNDFIQAMTPYGPEEYKGDSGTSVPEGDEDNNSVQVIEGASEGVICLR